MEGHLHLQHLTERRTASLDIARFSSIGSDARSRSDSTVVINENAAQACTHACVACNPRRAHRASFGINSEHLLNSLPSRQVVAHQHMAAARVAHASAHVMATQAAVAQHALMQASTHAAAQQAAAAQHMHAVQHWHAEQHAAQAAEAAAAGHGTGNQQGGGSNRRASWDLAPSWKPLDSSQLSVLQGLGGASSAGAGFSAAPSMSGPADGAAKTQRTVATFDEGALSLHGRSAKLARSSSFGQLGIIEGVISPDADGGGGAC